MGAATTATWTRGDAARAADGAIEKLPSGLKFLEVTQGVDGSGREIGETIQLIVDYEVRRGESLDPFDGALLESSNEKLRFPLLFTVGTGAVNKGFDEVVRTMKPGGVRRVALPANYDKGITEAVVVQVRLRSIKGTSSYNICVVPPRMPDKPSILCQEGARKDAP